MKAFAALLERLAYTPSRNDKLRLLAGYFASAPDPDRGYALAALTDGLFFRLPLRRILMELIEARVDPVLFGLSRDYVGDTAETIALLWPDSEKRAAPRLSEVVETLQAAAPADFSRSLAAYLDALDATARYALLKLLTGALRVGVSARLAKTALAEWSGVPVSEIEETWHGLRAPYLPLFAWLSGTAPRPATEDLPIFRPLMLSHQIEDRELASIEPQAFMVEWKWDGIRVQASTRSGAARLFSRAGDDISAGFPDVLEHLPESVVLDGELLVMRGDGEVGPFNDLQQRLNRKTVTPAMLKSYPAHIRLYDMLFEGEEDLRPLPFVKRRARLESWHARTRPSRTDLSEVLEFHSVDELKRLWADARETGIEGLMLKRRDSPYIAGRPKGHWYKWKRAPLTLDAVLMYAQRGSGKRSSFYSDYTFGAWLEVANGERELVPVGKAYFGFTDAELRKLDSFVRNHTVDRFGPVRQVEPKLVFEVAFDSVHRSTRHKSGVAMRFPRIHRIRWDKPAEEADMLDTLMKMIVE